MPDPSRFQWDFGQWKRGFTSHNRQQYIADPVWLLLARRDAVILPGEVYYCGDFFSYKLPKTVTTTTQSCKEAVGQTIFTFSFRMLKTRLATTLLL